MKKKLIYYLFITLSIFVNTCSDGFKEESTGSYSSTIKEVTPVPSTTNDSTPDYVFNANMAGTITYGGSCSSSTTSAISGNNTITLASLSDGTYSDCTITVTNQKLDLKSSLTITSFTVDTTAPTIERNGSDVVTVECGDVFVDPGVTVSDNCDTDLTSSVTVGGDAVDTSILGDYLIIYNVADSAGNPGEIGRVVRVAGSCSGEGEGEGEGEIEPSQQLAQALLDAFESVDTDVNGAIDFLEAQGTVPVLREEMTHHPVGVDEVLDDADEVVLRLGHAESIGRGSPLLRVLS